VYLVAAYFIISGVAEVIAGMFFTGVGNWWAYVILGIISAVLGIYMLAVPGMGALSLAYLFAIWMIMSGATELSAAIEMRKVIGAGNEFWFALLGVISLVAGAYVIFYPGIGVLALVYTVGVYGFLAGIALIAFSFKVKGLGAELDRRRATA